MAARSLSGPHSTSPDRDQASAGPARPYLTAVGRRVLGERIPVLEQTVTDLHDALGDAEGRCETVEAYQRARQELARLTDLLRNAQPIETIPDDPSIVELGDTVVIGLAGGSTENYTIVDAAEAPIDDARISIDSPLGRALLGRPVGEEVEVTVPTGSYRCAILSASRRVTSTHPGSVAPMLSVSHADERVTITIDGAVEVSVLHRALADLIESQGNRSVLVAFRAANVVDAGVAACLVQITQGLVEREGTIELRGAPDTVTAAITVLCDLPELDDTLGTDESIQKLFALALTLHTGEHGDEQTACFVSEAIVVLDAAIGGIRRRAFHGGRV